MSKVFIVMQANEETRGIVEATMIDNPNANLEEQPAMVRIDQEGSMTIRRETVEEVIGREFDLRELHVNLISLSGHVDETEDSFTLSWNT